MAVRTKTEEAWELYRQGLSYGEIARRLDISPYTAKHYVARMRRRQRDVGNTESNIIRTTEGETMERPTVDPTERRQFLTGLREMFEKTFDTLRKMGWKSRISPQPPPVDSECSRWLKCLAKYWAAL